MGWKTDYRSIYYTTAPEPDTPVLTAADTAILVIDVQNTYLVRPDRASLCAADQTQFDLWTQIWAANPELAKQAGSRVEELMMPIEAARARYTGYLD